MRVEANESVLVGPRQKRQPRFQINVLFMQPTVQPWPSARPRGDRLLFPRQLP